MGGFTKLLYKIDTQSIETIFRRTLLRTEIDNLETLFPPPSAWAWFNRRTTCKNPGDVI